MQGHAAIRAEFTKGTYHQMIQMATGTGKTVVFSQLPQRMNDLLPGQTMVLAHREELIDQAIDKMRKVNPHLRIDKEKAEHKADPSLADVIVASVSTLGRQGTQRVLKYNWENFDKFVIDEAHHSTATTYQNVLDVAGLLRENDKRLLLGVTATPQRSDGQALAKLYQKIVFSYSMRQAIEDGWLAEPRGIKVRTNTSLDAIKTKAGDYDQSELADTVNNPARNQLIVKAWLDNGEDRQTVGFTVDIQHAKDLAKTFQYYGVSAEAIWGDDPERKEKLAAHRAGKFKVLLNCGVLTEGYDDPNLGCIILARPTKSSVLFTQMVGRGTRLQEGCDNLLIVPKDSPWKRDCIIIDVVDTSSRHSLITLPTLMGMAAGVDLKGRGIVTAVKELEEAQKDFPHIDFSTLPDISQLDTFIENVNLFEIKLPDEVTQHSELTWNHSATGGYVLLLPEKEAVSICQNALDKYEISAIIKSKHYKGERDTLEAAFSAADGLVADVYPEVLKLTRQHESWHDDPATPAQITALKRMYKGKQIPADITKGKASRLISYAKAGKKR